MSLLVSPGDTGTPEVVQTYTPTERSPPSTGKQSAAAAGKAAKALRAEERDTGARGKLLLLLLLVLVVIVVMCGDLKGRRMRVAGTPSCKSYLQHDKGSQLNLADETTGPMLSFISLSVNGSWAIGLWQLSESQQIIWGRAPPLAHKQCTVDKRPGRVGK